MQTFLKTLAATLIALVLISMNAPFVRAWACCDPWGWVGHAAFIQAGTQIVSSIASATNRVLTTLEKTLYHSLETGFGKLYRELTKQSAQQRAFKQGAIALRTRLYMQQRAHQAAQRAVLPAEQSLSVTNAALLAEQDTVIRKQIAHSNSAFAQSFYSAKPVDPAIMVEQHRFYCSSDEQTRQRCSLQPSLALQNADLSLNTILNPGAGQYQTLSENEYKAALAFVRNAVHPLTEAPLARIQLKSAQAQANALEQLSDQAALSAAAHSFHALIAQHTRRHQQ